MLCEVTYTVKKIAQDLHLVNIFLFENIIELQFYM